MKLRIKDIIIEETKDYILVNKPPGILSQSDGTDDPSVIELVSKHVGKKTHLLSRMDRPVSGIMILSKKKEFTKWFLKQLDNEQIFKRYIAIVEGHPEKDNSTMKHFHVHDKKHKKARVSNEEDLFSKEIKLEYKLIEKLDRYSILDIELKSGKFHQIRSQLAFCELPVKGDVKYGARRGNKDRSIHLHSYSINFKDRENKLKTFVASLDNEDTLWAIAKNKIDQQD